MRKVMLFVAVAAVAGCGGIKKEQYAAKEAEAAKYKAAMQDEAGKAEALEAKAKSLEQQNASLQAQVGDLQKQLSDTSAAKSELEVTTAKLTQQTSDYAAKQTIRLNERLLFPENSSKLSAESKRSLDAMADAISQVKDKSVIVAGYTDNTEGGKGADVKRWQLSTTRATEVAKYLAGRGLDPRLIAVAGFGEGRPIAPNDTLANKALNRRVEIALTPVTSSVGTIDVKPATLGK